MRWRTQSGLFTRLRPSASTDHPRDYARQRMINRRGAAPTGGNATPLNNHCGRPCAGRFVLAPLSGGARRSAAPPCPRPAAAAAEMNSHTKRGGDFVGQVCPTKSTFCMAGRPRYRARCCWGCRVPVRRAPARPARRAPRPSGAAGALGRVRAMRWVTAGGVPPPAGGGGALRPAPTARRLRTLTLASLAIGL